MDEERDYRVMSPAKEKEAREWAMFLHLSLLLGTVAPIIGLAVPVIIWQIKKEEMPSINVHGKNVVNWIISFVIYFVISAILFFVIVGIPLVIALVIVSIVFPIMGGIKANNGEVWKYPMTIEFIK